ncbi:MAG TPA: hypothetical protein VMT56_03565 [Candidatus Bathyarchaeia archaeon]|nr:hypothetical protein [Candidatus Bathyarchaeia archaeon]
MKIAIKALLIMIIFAIMAGSAYFFVEQEYVKKKDLMELNSRFALLQEDLSRLKHDISEEIFKNSSDIRALANKFESFQAAFTTLKESEKSEQEKANQTLLSLRQQNDQLFLSLQSNIKELRETYLSKSESVNFFSTAINLGSLPSGKSAPLNYNIPDKIPDSAREIFIYAYIATDFVKGGDQGFKISVKLDDSREAAFYLYTHANTKPGWAYNSDNVWLPLPVDRKVRIQALGEPLFGSWEGGVKIIAYR